MRGGLYIHPLYLPLALPPAAHVTRESQEDPEAHRRPGASGARNAFWEEGQAKHVSRHACRELAEDYSRKDWTGRRARHSGHVLERKKDSGDDNGDASSIEHDVSRLP